MWSLAPNQIEAALTLRGVDIGWWHRLTCDAEGYPRLSSRRLLAVLGELPDTSGYQTVLRDGAWPVWMQMLKELHKETALHRASLYAGGDNAYDATIFVDPREAKQGTEPGWDEEAEDDMYSMLGWT